MNILKPPKNDNEKINWREWVTKVFNTRDQHGIAWDDVYPAAVSVGSGASLPSFTSFNGNLMAYEFLGTGVLVKDLSLKFQMPHTRKDGSVISPHIHLHVPDDATGGIIKFGCEYTWENVDDGGSATTTIYGTVTRTASQGVNANAILSFSEVVGTGMGLSSIFSCRLFRDPDDAGDTFEASVWLKSADIHVQKTWLGSFLKFARS